MTVRKVVMYETDDGGTHTDFEVAKAANAKYHATQRLKKRQEVRLTQLKAIICDVNRVSQNSSANLALDLLNKPVVAEQLRDVLNSVLRMHTDNQKMKAAKKA